MAREELKTLTEQMFYILIALHKPMYGLEIANYINDLTAGSITLPPGTLYALLARFEQENYIELVKPMTKRKVYIISDLGKALLNDEYNRLQKMIVDFEKVRAEND